MWNTVKKLFILLCFGALYGENLEIHLATRSNVKPLYITRIHTDPSEWDWRYFEELREILSFDLNQGGFVKVAPLRQELEETLDWSDLKNGFKLEKWKQEKFPYVIVIEVHAKQFVLTVFDLEKVSSKKYSPIPLTGRLEVDRRMMHRLADAFHKDLFGIEGISSLRILCVQRTKNELEGLDFLSEIWICDADGANARQLTQEKGYCLSPLFLPKTTNDPEFLYVFNNEGQTKIFRSSLSRPQEKKLAVSLRGNQALPAISHSGLNLAFITDVAGRPDLFLQHLDKKKEPIGKARQIYSSPHATQASPTFSPDERKIAFVSDKDGPPRIYVMNLPDLKDTQRYKPELITTKNRENTSPAWSPDGKKLAYSAKTEGVRQVWIYDFEAKEEIQLTTGPENKENPAWAPDSLHLVYNTESATGNHLYLIHLLDPDPIQIGNGRFASWETR